MREGVTNSHFLLSFEMKQTQEENLLQVALPLDLGLKLPEENSLRLLIKITDEMDFKELYATYPRHESVGEVSAILSQFG